MEQAGAASNGVEAMFLPLEDALSENLPPNVIRKKITETITDASGASKTSATFVYAWRPTEEEMRTHVMPTAAGRVQAKAEVTLVNYALLASLAERHDKRVAAAGRHAARADTLNCSYAMQEMAAGNAMLGVDVDALVRNRVLAERGRCRAVYDENRTLRKLIGLLPRPQDVPERQDYKTSHGKASRVKVSGRRLKPYTKLGHDARAERNKLLRIISAQLRTCAGEDVHAASRSRTQPHARTQPQRIRTQP